MKTLTTLTLASLVYPAITFAQLSPEQKFEKQYLWANLTATSTDGNFSFKVKETLRGTYRVKPEAQDFEFPAELEVQKNDVKAPQFEAACKDLYNQNRFRGYGEIILRFHANPYSSNQKYVLSNGKTVSWNQFENLQTNRKSALKVEWNNAGAESDVGTTWLVDQRQRYRKYVNDYLATVFESQKANYNTTGEMELNMDLNPELRIFACDLARGKAKLSVSFELEGEPATVPTVDWIGNVNLKAIHDGLQEMGDRPEELSLFEAGIALGQEIQLKTTSGLAVYQNGRAGKLLKGLFEEKNGVFRVKGLDDKSMFDLYAGLPELKTGAGKTQVVDDFITMKVPLVRMVER